jgi:hypothetical protein
VIRRRLREVVRTEDLRNADPDDEYGRNRLSPGAVRAHEQRSEDTLDWYAEAA